MTDQFSPHSFISSYRDFREEKQGDLERISPWDNFQEIFRNLKDKAGRA